MTDDEAVQIGREAQQVLGNRAYKHAYEQIEKVLVDELARMELTKERGEYLRQLLSCSRKHRQLMEQALANGNFAAEAIRQDAERKKWYQRSAA